MTTTSLTAAAPRTGRGRTLTHTLAITGRNLAHIKSNPESLISAVVSPLMFTLLFVFVFGGAIGESRQEYIQYVVPGILVQTVAFAGVTTAIGMNSDFSSGIMDRFRSLPISRSAPLLARLISSKLSTTLQVAVILVAGLLLGFRFGDGLLNGLLGLLLAIAFGTVLSLVGIYLGLVVKTPEAVNSVGFLVMFPLMFASSIFAPTDTMPGWLEAFTDVNPLSVAADAIRGLMTGADTGNAVALLVAWLVGLTVVFVPLSVARFHKKA